MFIALAALLSSPLLPASQAAGDELRIYVSLPHRGANADTSKLITQGVKAALRTQGNRIGNRRLRLIQLNDASGARWQPRLVRRNARRAAKDPRAVAYIGELNSEATAIAKPIIERAGMAMFAPVSTADSLTRANRANPALDTGTGGDSVKPSLFRAIPNDSAQAVALVEYLRRSQVRSFVLLDDGALYGKSLADSVAAEARRRGLRILTRHRTHPDGKGRRALVRKVAAVNPRAVLFAGSQSSDAAPLFRALHRAMPRALLFGGDALAHDSFARRIGQAQKMTRLVHPSSHTDSRNKPLRRLLGDRPDPVTVFAFDGTRAILGAIKRSGAAGISATWERREAIRDELFRGGLQQGAVGLWKILPNGDSSNGVFDAIRLRDGRVIEPAETAAFRHIQRRRATKPRGRHANRDKDATARSSSGPVNVVDPSLMTPTDIEALMRMIQRQRVDLLDEQLRQQIEAVKLRNEAVASLNSLLSVCTRLDALFPPDSSSESRINTLVGWRDEGSELRTLLTQIAAHERSNLVTGSTDVAAMGAMTRDSLGLAVVRIRDQIDTLTGAQQLDMLRLQNLSNKRNAAIDVLTNSKKVSDHRSSIIGNMR